MERTGRDSGRPRRCEGHFLCRGGVNDKLFMGQGRVQGRFPCAHVPVRRFGLARRCDRFWALGFSTAGESAKAEHYTFGKLSTRGSPKRSARRLQPSRCVKLEP